MRKRIFVGLAAIAASTAQAQEHPTKCCGIVSLTVHADGAVTGRYQHPAGRLFGHMDVDGTVRGIWVQAAGFNSCTTSNDGSRHWGRFEFEDIGSAQVTGTWAYCEADPVVPWGFQNDPVLRDMGPAS